MTNEPAPSVASESGSPAHASARRGKRFRRIRKTLILLGVLYCGVAMVLTGCADKLILFPTTHRVNGLVAQRVDVPVPQGVIEVWKARSLGALRHEPEAFVMTFVGNASRAEYDIEPMAAEWGKRPVEVWAVNYPGFGGSTGPARLKSIPPAALAAYDRMKQEAGNRPTFVCGRSIGTTAALYVAAHRDVNGLILHSPPALRSLIIGQFGWWNLWLAAIPVALAVPQDLDSTINAAHVHAPAVFLITQADTFVTPKYQQQVVDAFAGPKRVVGLDADHNDAIPSDAVPALQAGIDWLMKRDGM